MSSQRYSDPDTKKQTHEQIRNQHILHPSSRYKTDEIRRPVGPQIDYEKFRQVAGLKTAHSARELMRVTKNKLKAEYGALSGGVQSANSAGATGRPSLPGTAAPKTRKPGSVSANAASTPREIGGGGGAGGAGGGSGRKRSVADGVLGDVGGGGEMDGEEDGAVDDDGGEAEYAWEFTPAKRARVVPLVEMEDERVVFLPAVKQEPARCEDDGEGYF